MAHWCLEGQHIVATYLGEYAVSGTVDLSRVKYGGDISHHIRLDKPVTIYGTERDRLIIDHKHIISVSSS